MLLKQFYLQSLGHASYFVASEETGDALVLDVRRDVEQYFDLAREQGMRIAYAADTHQHNDYVTGICELPEHGDVQLLAGARAELNYPVRHMNDGDRLQMGEVEIKVLHTPGHTPEHIALLLTDHSRGDEPSVLLSGGALLVGDIARPDLLGGPDETRKSAEEFCDTLQQKILTLPDHVEVYPTHVAGSLCGGSIGSRLATTIGYERRMNHLLKNLDAKDEFVRQCLELKDLPAVPPYWRRMRAMNQDGPPLLGVLREPPALGVDEFDGLRRNGAIVLDCRSPEAFSAHIPGAYNVGLGSSFPTWAGTVLPADAQVVLVLEKPDDLWEVTWHLLRTGYEPPRGWLRGGMQAWRSAAREVEVMPQWTVYDLKRELEQNPELMVLDVRQPAEWTEGHIPRAEHITGALLPEKADQIPQDKPVAVVCGSGYRSSVSGSVLQRRGQQHVFNVLGGMSAWKEAGFETTAEE